MVWEWWKWRGHIGTALECGNVEEECGDPRLESMAIRFILWTYRLLQVQSPQVMSAWIEEEQYWFADPQSNRCVNGSRDEANQGWGRLTKIEKGFSLQDK